jgi:hypothetical protein
MKDTKPEIQKMQLDIIHAKTDHERVLMGIEMIESVRQVIKNSIRIERPDLNEREIIAELFERYHKAEFSNEKLEMIKTGIRNFSGPR